MKYVRTVIKRRADDALLCPPAPIGVSDGCRADVSFVTEIIIYKFATGLANVTYYTWRMNSRW